jgi:hypothetical protein
MSVRKMEMSVRKMEMSVWKMEMSACENGNVCMENVIGSV